jgi:precorrin-6x reductase
MISTFAITVNHHVKKTGDYGISLRNIITDETFKLLINNNHPLHYEISKIKYNETQEINTKILSFEGEIRTEIIAEAFEYHPKNEEQFKYDLDHDLI